MQLCVPGLAAELAVYLVTKPAHCSSLNVMWVRRLEQRGMGRLHCFFYLYIASHTFALTPNPPLFHSNLKCPFISLLYQCPSLFTLKPNTHKSCFYSKCPHFPLTPSSLDYSYPKCPSVSLLFQMSLFPNVWHCNAWLYIALSVPGLNLTCLKVPSTGHVALITKD